MSGTENSGLLLADADWNELTRGSVLRGVLRQMRVRAGGRLLDVGCEAGEVVVELTRRGIETNGVDDRAEKLSQGAAKGGRDQIHQVVYSGALPHAAHTFDGVLVRGGRVYEGDWTSPEVILSTANLLSTLKPGKRMVFLVHRGVEGTDGRVEGLLRHLSLFPGGLTAEECQVGGWLSIGRWLMPGAYRPRYVGVTMELPQKPITRLEWHRFAREIILGKKRSAA